MAGQVPSDSVVIVALPQQDDYVNQVSSEPKPHLTLLYLGQPGFDQVQMAHIDEYVAYASTFLNPFWMDVLSRGELGPKQADVLFFAKEWSRSISRFRNQLLQDPLISTAYNSAQQFEGWVPHLTLGYPATPAKKPNADFNGFGMVHFDRIAVWTGNSTGPEFPLVPRDNEMEVAMSQLDPASYPAAENFISHHGIKGMKWGVRRSQAQLDAASGSSISSDAKAAASAQAKINSGGTKSLSNQELQGLVNRMNLERQYSQLQTQHQSELDRGLQTTKNLLKVGKTVEDVRKFLETPTGKAVKRGLRGAFAAAKVGAAAYTGGASGAAAAGTDLVVRRAANHFTNVGR